MSSTLSIVRSCFFKDHVSGTELKMRNETSQIKMEYRTIFNDIVNRTRRIDTKHLVIYLFRHMLPKYDSWEFLVCMCALIEELFPEQQNSFENNAIVIANAIDHVTRKNWNEFAHYLVRPWIVSKLMKKIFYTICYYQCAS